MLRALLRQNGLDAGCSAERRPESNAGHKQLGEFESGYTAHRRLAGTDHGIH